MSGKNIATIYFYIISAASLALIVIGIFNGVNFVINSTQYDKYPLRYGPVGDCQTLGYPVPIKMVQPPGGEIRESTPTAQEIKKQKDVCEKQQESERKQRKVEDIRNSVTFTLIGLILFLIHFPQAKKYSKD